MPEHEARILARGELTQGENQYFRKRYGKRFIRALRAVEEGRVVRYHFMPSDTTVWIVRGSDDEYRVIPGIFCTGRDFYQSVVMSRESKMCYHMLAQQIAELRGTYETVEATDSERRQILSRWRARFSVDMV